MRATGGCTFGEHLGKRRGQVGRDGEAGFGAEVLGGEVGAAGAGRRARAQREEDVGAELVRFGRDGAGFGAGDLERDDRAAFPEPAARPRPRARRGRGRRRGSSCGPRAGAGRGASTPSRGRGRPNRRRTSRAVRARRWSPVRRPRRSRCPASRWNCRSAASVSGPRMPSSRPASKPSALSRRWSTPTSSPRSIGRRRYSSRSPRRKELSTNAPQVSGPQMPSTRSPRASWNARTASSVAASKVPVVADRTAGAVQPVLELEDGGAARSEPQQRPVHLAVPRPGRPLSR